MSRWLAVIGLVAIVIGSVGHGIANRTQAQSPSEPRQEEKPLKLPDNWNPNDPLPVVKSNCVRCHLTAGRELTTPVRDLARSVHDRHGMSCNDCHGGDIKNDATAHENEHGFIGTKLSAHIAACAECHRGPAESFKKSKHYWDLAKRINREYPVCVDCHGNHDVGRPPAEFSLMNVCTDCHKQFAKDMPAATAVVEENDRLWQVLRKVHVKNVKADDPTPAAFRKELDRVRTLTGRLIHRAQPVTAEEAQGLNKRTKQLREGLETWLKEQR